MYIVWLIVFMNDYILEFIYKISLNEGTIVYFVLFFIIYF